MVCVAVTPEASPTLTPGLSEAWCRGMAAQWDERRLQIRLDAAWQGSTATPGESLRRLKLLRESKEYARGACMMCQETTLRLPAIEIAPDGPATDCPPAQTGTVASTRGERAEPRRWTPGGMPAQAHRIGDAFSCRLTIHAWTLGPIPVAARTTRSTRAEV